MYLHLIQLRRVESSTTSLNRSISNNRVSVFCLLLLLLLCFIEILVINANSVDPDQTPRSVASDLGLHSLPVTILGFTRLKLVKKNVVVFFFFLTYLVL